VSVEERESKIQESFERDGFVILRGFLELDIVTGVKNVIGRYMDHLASELLAEGTISRRFEDEPFETRLLRLVENCRDRVPMVLREELHMPEMFNMFFHSRLLDLVEPFLGPEIRLYPNYSVRPKLPEDPKTQVPWHQDACFTAAGKHGHDPMAGGLSADQLRMLNIWSPLVPARPANGCMKFVPGTHKIGVVPHRDTEHYMEIEDLYLKPRVKDAIDVILDPGDVVLFSNLLFHSGQPNVSSIVRWSCDWRYQDATQSTLREYRGHMARSRTSPENVVRDAAHWARLSLKLKGRSQASRKSHAPRRPLQATTWTRRLLISRAACPTSPPSAEQMTV
jgi:ectoine hydroxylase-related dioxygenase (phytanoyl-CoA dioxygenase family)